MNASEQATSIERVCKIAAIANLMIAELPQMKVDLSPWLQDNESRELDDPHSIDLAFHFPTRNFTYQGHTLLMQIRLPVGDRSELRPTSIELSGHDFKGQQWRLDTAIQATDTTEEFWGIMPPLPHAQMKLKKISQKVINLFDPVSQPGS
ncbi:MAG: hypothetical protein MUF49_32005 [Oculatellaceae cyanobacterium Prado106]|nr:hypothetical protein [Oculatellaceae cyanobacterium Prado106]